MITKKKTPKPIVNHVAIVVDKSGSMRGLAGATLRALNKTLEDVASNAAKTGQETFVSLYEFGDYVGKRYASVPVGMVKSEVAYNCDLGSTALFDAAGQAINDLSVLPARAGASEAFLLIVMTDGEENASRRYTARTLDELMRHVQATDKWTLTFLLPPHTKRDFCDRFAIPEGNVAEWEQTDRGVEQAREMRTSGLSSYFAARTVGATNLRTFYTDASKIKPTDIKKLDDVSGEVKIWNVDGEVEIMPFVESHRGYSYAKGRGFYQLTKKEEIQGHKKILIMEKGKKSVYEGDKARKLIGLPIGVGTVKVTPGNHSNFDIFIQSTSTNRKLVRGTRFIYYP